MVDENTGPGWAVADTKAYVTLLRDVGDSRPEELAPLDGVKLLARVDDPPCPSVMASSLSASMILVSVCLRRRWVGVMPTLSRSLLKPEQ
ncbi:hypothetical protein ABZP36_018240 [Zizania latifolia]